MDTPEKLKALHEHCDRHKTCQSCILNGACCLNYIDDKITGMYENIKTQQNAAARTEDIPTEDGTAARATHYLACPIQPIDLIQYTLTKEELIGFLKGNIIKYSMRAGRKDGSDDAAKARHYRQKLAEARLS